MDPLKIIEKYYKPGSEAYRILVRHSALVTKKALNVAKRVPELSPDLEFIKEAAMLHDIGIFLTDEPEIDCHGSKKYIWHGCLGKEILEKEGFPKHAKVCERHTGVGISLTDIERQNLPIPKRDMNPISIEEQIICFADSFFSKTPNILNKEKSIEEIKNQLAKFGEDKIKKFEGIPTGNSAAHEYHKHIYDCLNTIFNNPSTPNYLSGPRMETPQNARRKRIDITFHNSSDKGFFSRLSNYGSLFCAKILFECKNFTQDLKNSEYDQMVGRFNNRTSTIGYIVCRSIEDKEKCIATCKDFVTNGRGYIVILTDNDIIEMLKALLLDDGHEIIDSLLQSKMDEVVHI